MSTPATNEFTEGLSPPGSGEPGVLYYQGERAIVKGLRHGWAYLRDNIDQLDNITRYSDDVERAAVRNLFTQASGQYLQPERITVGYPFVDSSGPQITAMVESETQVHSGEFIGDNLGGDFFPGVVTAGGPNNGLQKGAIRARTVAIMIASPHPDVVGYIDGIVDAIMYALDYWFMTPAESGGAGLVGVDQGDKTAVDVDPRSDGSGNRLWVLTSRWRVMGFGGTSLRIPPPKTRVLVGLDASTQSGVRGGVVPVRRVV